MKPFIFLAMSTVSLMISYYQKPAEVVMVGTSETIFETADGNHWIVGNPEFRIGDKAILTFSDNDTKDFVLDDDIIDLERR